MFNLLNEHQKHLVKNFITSIKNEGHEVIFLTVYGAHLYGTNTENSDLDIRGVFIPSKKSILTGNIRHSFSFSTNDDKSKNIKDDVDIQLKSIHSFFSNLTKNDTNALDLLFAYTNNNATLLTTRYWEYILVNKNIFLNKQLSGFLGYIYIDKQRNTG